MHGYSSATKGEKYGKILHLNIYCVQRSACVRIPWNNESKAVVGYIIRNGKNWKCNRICCCRLGLTNDLKPDELLDTVLASMAIKLNHKNFYIYYISKFNLTLFSLILLRKNNFFHYYYVISINHYKITHLNFTKLTVKLERQRNRTPTI